MEQAGATLDRPAERQASPVHPEERASWSARPAVALMLRVAIFTAPIVASVLASFLVARRWPRPDGLGASIGWLCVLIVIGGIAMVAIDRVARRFLPLAALLRMTLIFPDQAPSRFNVAIRSGTTKQLERRLQHVREFGLGATEAEAAETLLHLAAALREHDRFTRGHGERVRAYTALIGEELGLDPVEISKLQWAGLIHDIGKLAIPAEVLNKPGRLTADEYELVKTHPAAGMALMGPLTGWLGEWALAVGEHHERWDGAGYPSGLARKEISLAGRIVAVADTFDVITATRSYKPAQSPQWARRELADNAGSQFDPEVVRAFLSVSLGKLRTVMWPLSWVAHIPFLGSTVSAPVSGFAAAAVAVVGSSVTGGSLAGAVPSDIDPIDRAPVVSSVVVDEALSPVTTSTILVIAGPASTAPSTTTSSSIETADSDGNVAPAIGTTGDEGESSGGTPQTIVVTTVGSLTATAALSETGDPAYPLIVTIPPAADPSTDPTISTVAPATTLVVTAPGTTIATTRPTTPVPTTVATTTPVPTTTVAPATTAAPTTTAALNGCDRARAGETSLSSADLTRCNLAGLQLVGVDLTGADLSFADLRGTRLTNSNLDGATLAQADLRGAILVDVTMRGMSAPKIDARAVNWERVDISGSTLTDAVFSDGRFVNVSFASIAATGVEFERAHLDTVGFNDAGLQEATFESAVLIDVKMQRVRAHASNFQAADASGIDLTNADLRESEMPTANLSNALLSGARIGSAALEETNFRFATGTPTGAASAEYEATICPDGSVRSSTCWP